MKSRQVQTVEREASQDGEEGDEHIGQITEDPANGGVTCVTQLNKATSRLPFGPNGARLIMKAVVPTFGPCRLAKPSRE